MKIKKIPTVFSLLASLTIQPALRIQPAFADPGDEHAREAAAQCLSALSAVSSTGSLARNGESCNSVSPQSLRLSPADQKKLVESAAQLAENIYIAGRLEEDLAQFQTLLEEIEKGQKPMSTFAKVQAGAGLALAGLTGYLAYKTKKAKDSRMLFYGLGTGVSGLAALSVGGSAMLTSSEGDKAKLAEVALMKQKIADARKELEGAKGRLKESAAKARMLDPGIEAKVAVALAAHGGSRKEIDRYLGEIAKVGKEKDEKQDAAMVEGLGAAGSLAALAKHAASNKEEYRKLLGFAPGTASPAVKGGAALFLTVALITGGLSAKDLLDSNELGRKLEQLGVEKTALERDYLEKVKSSLSETFR